MKLNLARLAVSLLLVPSGLGADLSRAQTLAQSDNPRLFPFLAKLRDGAVEFLFGQHPTKDAGRSATSLESIKARYKDEIVLRFNVTTTDEEEALAEAAARLFLDVWAFTDDFVDIRLHKDEISPLIGLLPKSLQLSYSTLISDLATAVHKSRPSDRHVESMNRDEALWDISAAGPADNLFFQEYQSLPVIMRWMKLLEAMFPAYVKYISVGTSYEGREIPALRVGVPGFSSPAEPRKTLVVTGGLHAREWISTSTVNYVAWSFITSFGKEPMITKFLDNFDIVFMPVVNPDGVEYSWQEDRLWRKSRQQTNFRFCRGFDLDHAFGFGWGSSNIQADPCSESYGGEQPFQAVEALELATWARNETLNNVKFVGLLDLHSYSQQVLFPYSYSCAIDPPNLENLQELATGIAKAIRLSNGQSYTVTSACEGAVVSDENTKNEVLSRLEAGGGSAIDWFYHEMRAHFSYQIKLRDTGSYGFLLPKEEIIPSGEEMFNAMKYVGDYLLGNNGIERINKATHREAEIGVEFADSDEDTMGSMELRKRRMRR